MRGARQGIRFGVAGGVAVLIASCGVWGTGESGEDVLRVAATVDYVSEDSTLVFRPGDVEFGTEVWASQTVEFEIATDDWIQHLSLHDRYVVDGSELVPTPDSEKHEYSLSDQGPFGGSFQVEVPELSEGDHSVSLSIPLSLEPSPAVGDALEPREMTLAIDLVYHVWAESAEIDPGFPTVEELKTADIEDAQGLNGFLDCRGVMSFHHSSVNDASDALSLASSYIRDRLEMRGHGELVEAVPVRSGEDGAEGLWAIVDSNGYVVGTVEQGQAIFMCENKPPYYAEPTVRYLHPGEGDE